MIERIAPKKTRTCRQLPLHYISVCKLNHSTLVRDLWAQTDIGTFTGNYTSSDIDYHLVMMLKITLSKLKKKLNSVKFHSINYLLPFVLLGQ